MYLIVFILIIHISDEEKRLRRFEKNKVAAARLAALDKLMKEYNELGSGEIEETAEIGEDNLTRTKTSEIISNKGKYRIEKYNLHPMGDSLQKKNLENLS